LGVCCHKNDVLRDTRCVAGRGLLYSDIHNDGYVMEVDIDLTEYAEIFFFQAEDGIRDIGVTGVQTCALPIYSLDPS